MKRIISILFLLSAPLCFAEDTLRTVENKAFREGEVMKFHVYYGLLSAGNVTISIMPEPVTMRGRSAFRVVGVGESAGAFDYFFKVRDRFETYIDKEMITPLLFHRHVEEGNFRTEQNYVFYPEEKKVYNGNKFKETPPYVQDLLSSYFYGRCLDWSDCKPNEVTSLKCFLDDSVFVARVRFIRRETIKTDMGTFKCMLFRPALQTGRVFKNEEDLNVWVTDDENKIPVRCEAKIFVGSVKMDLIGYSGLANPISLIPKKK